MAKLLAIVKKELGKKDSEKAIDALTDQVEDNKYAWDGEITKAKRKVKAAEKEVARLNGVLTATGSDVINAQDAVDVAADDLARLEAAYTARF